MEIRHDVRSGRWVVGEQWKWITVVRKPEGVEWDGRVLVTFLGQLVGGRGRGENEEEGERGVDMAKDDGEESKAQGSSPAKDGNVAFYSLTWAGFGT